MSASLSSDDERSFLYPSQLLQIETNATLKTHGKNLARELRIIIYIEATSSSGGIIDCSCDVAIDEEIDPNLVDIDSITQLYVVILSVAGNDLDKRYGNPGAVASSALGVRKVAKLFLRSGQRSSTARQRVGSRTLSTNGRNAILDA